MREAKLRGGTPTGKFYRTASTHTRRSQRTTVSVFLIFFCYRSYTIHKTKRETIRSEQIEKPTYTRAKLAAQLAKAKNKNISEFVATAATRSFERAKTWKWQRGPITDNSQCCVTLGRRLSQKRNYESGQTLLTLPPYLVSPSSSPCAQQKRKVKKNRWTLYLFVGLIGSLKRRPC